MSNDNETPEHTVARRNFDSGKPATQTRRDLDAHKRRKMVMPLEPNATTLEAIAELERGDLPSFLSVEALMNELNSDD